MAFLSSILGGIGSAAGGAIGSGIVGLGTDVAKGAIERAWGQTATHSARKWEERMRATQYQTAVSDLEAAGLNPMLAYTLGGAGTPNVGASITPRIGGDSVGDIQRGVSTARAIRTQDPEVRAAIAGAKTAESGATTAKNIADFSREKAEYDVNDAFYRFQNTQKQGELIDAQIGATNAQQMRTNLETLMRKLDWPYSKAESDFYSTEEGRKYIRGQARMQLIQPMVHTGKQFLSFGQ